MKPLKLAKTKFEKIKFGQIELGKVKFEKCLIKRIWLFEWNKN